MGATVRTCLLRMISVWRTYCAWREGVWEGGKRKGGKEGGREGECEGDLEKAIYYLPYITCTVYADSNPLACIQ